MGDDVWVGKTEGSVLYEVKPGIISAQTCTHTDIGVPTYNKPCGCFLCDPQIPNSVSLLPCLCQCSNPLLKSTFYALTMHQAWSPPHSRFSAPFISCGEPNSCQPIGSPQCSLQKPLRSIKGGFGAGLSLFRRVLVSSERQLELQR